MHSKKKLILVSAILFSFVSTAKTKNNIQLADLTPSDCVVKPSEIIEVGSPTSGVIESIFFDRGQHVQLGNHLVQLDSRVEIMDTHLASTKASTSTAIDLRKSIVKLGYKTKERSIELVRDELIPDQEIDKIENDLRIAELNLKLEEENKDLADIAYERSLAVLDRRSILSKVDGVIVKRYKSVGERVNDDPILQIAQLDPLHIETVLPMKYYPQLHEGMIATVSPVTGPQSYNATVSVVDQVMDPASGTFGVRLTLDNPEYQIPAGVLCQVAF